MLLLVVAALLLSIADGRLRKYMSEVCVLTGMPVRSPAEYHVFTTSKEQRCYIYTGAGGNSPGHATFHNVHEYTPESVVLPGGGTTRPKTLWWRIESANIIITKSDLDTGVGTNSNSYAYIHQLDDTQAISSTAPKTYTQGAPTGTAVAGQVLGQKLGGKADVQNLFPQSTLYQAEYQAIETEIYNCLSNNYASKALLEWTFLYQTDTALRPYAIKYHVTFTHAVGSATTCSNAEHYVKN